MKAPNGEESNLTDEQYKLVRTPEFKAWFGDWENDHQNASKVVDENGEPLVVYRGLQTKTDYKKSGFQYFALYQDYAEMWSKDMGGIGNVISVFLCIKEPLLFEKYNDELAEYDLYSFGKQGLLQVSSELETKMPYLAQIGSIENTDGAEYLADNLFEELKTCDGVFGYDAGHYGEQFVFVTKKPEQIKLADGTNTTFDSNNPDIRYADGGGVFNTTPNNHKDIYKNRATVNVNKKEFIFSRLNYTESNVFIIELPSGEEIGRATLNEDGGYLYNIRINENYRRIGLGKLLYEYIEMVTGKPLTPSPIKISIEAKKLWAKRNPNVKYKNGATINNNKMEKPQEKQFDYYKWYKHYNFRAGFSETYSIVAGDNHPESLKYYKTNDVNYVVADTKRILKEKGWNYAEILDKSNDEIALINADGKLHAYKKGSEYWGLKTEEQFEDGGNLENNFKYEIGGL